MKKFILVIVASMMFISCTKQKITYKGNDYTLVDLDKGIFVDETNKKYKLNYVVKDGNVIFSLIEVEKE